MSKTWGCKVCSVPTLDARRDGKGNKILSKEDTRDMSHFYITFRMYSPLLILIATSSLDTPFQIPGGMEHVRDPATDTCSLLFMTAGHAGHRYQLSHHLPLTGTLMRPGRRGLPHIDRVTLGTSRTHLL